MNSKKIFIYLSIISIIFISSCSNYRIYNLKEAKDIEIENHGLIYALPKTVLRVEVEATQTEFKPGPYASYASKYLGISNVPKKDSIAWFISDVQISTYPEPDPNQYYYIETNRFNQTDLLTLTETGLIVSLEGEAGKPASGSKTDLFLNQVFNQPIELTQLPVMDAQTERIDTTYRTIITDTSFLRIPVLRKQQVNKSLEEKAEEIANLILELREEKIALLIGDINEFPDGKALEIIINEFEKMEKQYLPLFTGTRTEQVLSAVYEFTPTINNQGSKNILLRFSPHKGILSNTDLSGNPVMVEVINRDFTRTFDDFKIHKDTLVEESKGLVYRVPDEAIVRVVNGSKVIATKKTSIAQYGKINILPKRLISKKGIKIDFYPETGGIKSIRKSE